MSKQGRVHLSMPDDLKNQARAQAILQGKDLSQVVRELLARWLAGEIQLSEAEGDPEDK